jgi:general secretion pathway protein L
MSRQILAIDIRNDFIAGVLLTTGLKNHTVTGSAWLPIITTSAEGDALTQALSLLLEKINAPAADLVISLPNDKALYRFLTVPFKEDHKIRQILPFELEPVLPISIDKLKIDFLKYTLGDQTEVLAVAMDQTVFQGYMQKLAAANIRPQLVVPGGFALIAQITALAESLDGASLLLDVDKDKATLFALRSDRTEMVRCLPCGIGDPAAAEALALRVRQTLTAWSDRIHDEVVPAVVYVSGPALENPENLQILKLALEIPVETVDLGQWLNRVEIADSVDCSPHLMNNALALAVLEAEGKPCPNFHRISSTMRNYWSAYRPFVVGPAILMFTVLVLAFSGVILENHYLQNQVDALDAQMEEVFKSTFPGARLTASVPALDQMKSKIKESKKSGAGSEHNAVQTRSIDVLLLVSQSIPNNLDVILNRITIGADEVTVAGETTDFNTVDDIKGRLEKNAMFKQITIASANMDKTGKRVLFKLKIDL